MHLGFIFLWTMWNNGLQSVVGDVVDGYLERGNKKKLSGFPDICLSRGTHYGETSSRRSKFNPHSFYLKVENAIFLLIHPLNSLLICAAWTYFPWGNWDEREARLRCTWWWAGGSRLCSSYRVLCRLYSETLMCQSLTGRTPWWPTLATGAHGPETTVKGLQEDRRREWTFIDCKKTWLWTLGESSWESLIS